jgi:hypothetical protein
MIDIVDHIPDSLLVLAMLQIKEPELVKYGVFNLFLFLLLCRNFSKLAIEPRFLATSSYTN